MHAAVITFPGSNREGDVARALKLGGARSPTPGTPIMTCPPAPIWSCCPAAFPMAIICAAAPSPAARISWMRCASPRGQGRPGAGHLQRLPDPVRIGPAARHSHPQCRAEVHLQDAASEGGPHRYRRSPGSITRDQVIEVCIAHGEGNYTADAETLARLEGDGRVAFRYCDAAATPTRPPTSTARSTTSPASIRKAQRARHDAASGKPDRER
jgi:hypothetical protein